MLRDSLCKYVIEKKTLRHQVYEYWAKSVETTCVRKPSKNPT